MTDVDRLIKDAGGLRPGWQSLRQDKLDDLVRRVDDINENYSQKEIIDAITALRERIRELEAAPTSEKIERLANIAEGVRDGLTIMPGQGWFDQIANTLRSLSQQVAAKDAEIARLGWERDSADANRDAFKDRAERAEAERDRISELHADAMRLVNNAERERDALRAAAEGIGPMIDGLIIERDEWEQKYDALSDEVAGLRRERDVLLRFAGECLEPWPESLCDLEGEMQERFHRAGLTEPRIADHHGDDYEIGDQVFFLTELGQRAFNTTIRPRIDAALDGKK